MNFFKDVYQALDILDANKGRMYFDETFVNRTSSHMGSGKKLSWNIVLNGHFRHNFPTFFRVKEEVLFLPWVM